MKPKRKPQIPANPFERQLIIEGQPLEVLAERDGYGKATGQQPQRVSIADFEKTMKARDDE
jgi:hypothetical protein